MHIISHLHMYIWHCICMAEMYAEVKFQKHLKNPDELEISLPKAELMLEKQKSLKCKNLR